MSRITGFTVALDDVDNKKLFDYFESIGINSVEKGVAKTKELLDVAVTVMESVQVSQDVQFVKHEVEKIITQLNTEVDGFADSLNKSVDDILNSSLNIDIEGSMMGKTKIWIREQLATLQTAMKGLKEGAEQTAKLIIENAEKASTEKLSGIEKGITDANNNFNPDLSTSYLGKLRKEIMDVQIGIQQFLDFGRTDSFSYKLRAQLETFFGEDSPILDAVNKIVKEQQNEINNELIKLREDISKKEGSTEMLNKTAVKGFLFEDEVEKILDTIAGPFGDMVSRTSLETKAGRTGKKGDFIYEFGESGNRLVIETKDESVGLKPMLTYLKETMEYRDCEFSILCTKELDQLPNQVNLFNLYEGNKLFCSAKFLPFAIRWSKLYMERIKQTKEEGEGVDMSVLTDKIAQVKNSLKSFVSIKSKLTNMDKAVTTNTTDIRILLDSIADDINTSLDELT